MNANTFVRSLLSGYPENVRPQDQSFISTLEHSIQDMKASGEFLRKLSRRLIDSEVRFPVWATIKQYADALQTEQRAMSGSRVSNEEFARWRMEACSLDDALRYMREQLVDSGEMSLETLAAITGKWNELGVQKHLGAESPRSVAGMAHVGSLVSLDAGGGRRNAGNAAPTPANADPRRSSIGGLDITSGGENVDSAFGPMGPVEECAGLASSFSGPYFPRTGPPWSNAEGAEDALLRTGMDSSASRSPALTAMGPSPLDRCGSCGKYYLRSGSCSCIVADYDDSGSYDEL
jgi:hypothetical protein